MLSPRWRKMLRDVLLHKSRTFLVVLAVAISMIAAGSMLNTWTLIRRVTAETYLASNPVSATLKLDRIDDALLARARAVPGIAAVRARRVAMASIDSTAERRSAQLFVMENFDTPQIGKLASNAGTWPPRDGEIAIEQSSLAFGETGLGQSISLHIGKGAPQALPVTGVGHDVSLPPGWMDHVVYGFVTPATLATLGAPAAMNEIQMVVSDVTADRDAVRRIAFDLKSQLEMSGGHVTHIDVPIPRQHEHAAQMDSLMLTQGAFGVLALLVCSFLIVNLIAAMLAGQTREIGIMKSLGASARQIGAMYYAFALLMGLLASAVALPIAVAIGRGYAAMNADMLNFSVDAFSIPWWSIAVQLLVGGLLPVAAAVLPVRRACAMSVNAALRDTGISADGGSLYLRRRMTIPGLSRPLLLSIGNAFRRRQRLLLTLLVLATGGAVFLGANNLRIAVRGSVDQVFDSQHFDIVLRFADPHATAQLETAIARVAGVERAEAWRGDTVSLAHKDGTVGDDFSLVGMPPDSAMIAPLLQEGRWLSSSDRNALVISRGLLKDEPALTVGSTLSLTVAGQPTQFDVVGLVEAGPQKIAYLPRAALDALHGDDRAGTLVVKATAADSVSQLSLIQRARGELGQAGLPVASSQRLQESRRAFEDHLLMVVDFLGVMAWVMIAVGGMGLAATMSLAVLERTREIGVLRAIGARHGAIVRMIQAEGLVIAVLGWLVSIPLSIPMSRVLADAFGKVMFATPTRYLPDGRGVAIWLGMVLVVSLLACTWPAFRATRIPTAAALNYE